MVLYRNESRVSILFVAAIMGLLGTGVAWSQNYIYGRADLPNGSQPTAVIVGDFNGDGKPDLAVTNLGDNTVSILLGVPAGTFGPPKTYPAGSSPSGLVAADFNGDGKLDLAVMNSCANCTVSPYTVTILLGNGDGTFQTSGNYVTGAGPIAIVAADFNGDAKMDLALANQVDSTVSVLLGNGDGTFQPQTSVAVGTKPYSFAVGDFNNDGKVDLVTVNIGAGTVTVLLSNADGTFNRVDSSSGLGPNSNAGAITVGDFNRDGELDVVAACNGSQLYLLLGNGSGAFQSPTIIPSSIAVAIPSVMAADFNRDGKLDLLEQGSGGAVIVLPGNGDGTFQNPLTSPLGTASPITYAVADLNGDGTPDLIFPDDNLSTVDVILGNGNGTFSSTSDVALAPDGYGPNSGVVADFNADGQLDLAVAEEGFPNGQVSVQLGNGDGTFQQPLVSPLTIAAINNGDLMYVGDFNGDGKPDLIIMDDYYKGFEVLLGNGDGTFQAAVNTNISSSNGMVFKVGDLNGDGKSDLVVITSGGGGYSTISSYLSNGDGTFMLKSQYTEPFGTVVVADVNNDGKLDIIANNSVTIFVMLGNGDGTFQAPITGPTASSNLSGLMVVHDFNGDGNADIAVGTYGGMAFFAGNGHGSFQAPVYSACGSATCSGSPTQALGYSGGKMVVGDFNGDGKLDLATYPPFDTTLSGAVILIGNGDGTFLGPYPVAPAGSTADLLDGDFNSDGITDLAIASFAYYGQNASVVTLYLSGPTLDFFPGTLIFGTQDTGTSSSPQSVTLTNLGPGSLRLNGIQTTGPFSETNDCGIGLSKAEACEIFATFEPSGNGPQSGKINFSDNFAAGLQSVSLAGRGYGPFVSISPSTLMFVGQLVGSSSAPQAVNLTNQGPGVLTPTIQITGDFTQTNNCGSSLAVGSACSINVTFEPTTTGIRTGMLTFLDNAAGNPQTVGLTGTGEPTVASFVPTSLAFGGQFIGTQSAAQTLTISNTGTGTLVIGEVAISGPQVGDFAQTNTCQAPVAVGANCVISVVFKPGATGTRNATITITDNASSSPQSVPMSGEGTSFGLAVGSGQSGSATLAAGATATYNLIMGGTGFAGTVDLVCSGAPTTGANCSVPTSLTLSPTTPSPFTVTVTTTSRTAANVLPGYPGWLWAFVVFAWVLFPTLRRNRKAFRSLPAIPLLLVFIMCSCGGGSSGSGPQVNPNGTPTGQYTLNISASGGSNTQSLSLQLTVQ